MEFEKNKGGLKAALNKIGIGLGDIVYVASDLKTFLFTLAMDFGVKTKSDQNQALHSFINELQEIVGRDGTLLFPVFSWDWCKGKGFDIKTTKGEVGTLSNWVLSSRSDFVRTRHPIYSFMVWGKDAGYLKEMDNQDAWSHASPFYYFQRYNAKQLLFNIDASECLTFGHYLEQEIGIPYRYPKYFFGEYTDEFGITEKRMYSMYVRDMDSESNWVISNEWLIENHAAKRAEWEGNVLTSIDLKKSYPVIRDDIVNNNGKNTLIYTFDKTKEQTIPYEVKGIEI